ncbi:MAG: riboflavin kinase [Rikenellaceae bacterium]|nr:riboflavin kinase [Rikenellaceae bacterium]
MTEAVLEGVVVEGRRLGRQLGFPTANIAVARGCTITNGVYRSEVEVEGYETPFLAMSNLGCNPSVGGSERRLESHLFDFQGELYGRRIRVHLLERLRDEQHFASVEALQAQLEKDKQTILNK